MEAKRGKDTISDEEMLRVAKLASRLSGAPYQEYLYRASVESNFKTDAVSSAGAVGLFQIMPQMAERWGFQAEEMQDPVKAAIVSAAIDNDNWSYDQVNKSRQWWHRAYNGGVDTRLKRGEWRKKLGESKENKDYFRKIRQAEKSSKVRSILKLADDRPKRLNTETQLGPKPSIGGDGIRRMFPGTEYETKEQALNFASSVIENPDLERFRVADAPAESTPQQPVQGIGVQPAAPPAVEPLGPQTSGIRGPLPEGIPYGQRDIDVALAQARDDAGLDSILGGLSIDQTREGFLPSDLLAGAQDQQIDLSTEPEARQQALANQAPTAPPVPEGAGQYDLPTVGSGSPQELIDSAQRADPLRLPPVEQTQSRNRVAINNSNNATEQFIRMSQSRSRSNRVQDNIPKYRNLYGVAQRIGLTASFNVAKQRGFDDEQSRFFAEQASMASTLEVMGTQVDLSKMIEDIFDASEVGESDEIDGNS